MKLSVYLPHRYENISIEREVSTLNGRQIYVIYDIYTTAEMTSQCRLKPRTKKH